ncbi:MAG: hypothetical protein GX206_03905 [Clostridiales bacterium]|nr:hypothetical protein [Clostridiales bacterium]
MMILKKSIISIGKATYTLVKFNCNLPKAASEANNVREQFIEVKTEGKETIIVFLKKESFCLEREYLRKELSLGEKSRIFILLPKEERKNFKINEQSYNPNKITGKISEKQLEDFLYKLAYIYYSKGDSKSCIEVLYYNLKDRYLVNTVMNSFTVKERKRCMDLLKLAGDGKKIKFNGRVWKPARMLFGLVQKNESLEEGPCILKLLQTFEKNGDKFIPLNKDVYKRIGKKVQDGYNSFRADKGAMLTADFSQLVFSKEKLNISLRYEIPGRVIINPRQARAVGFSSNVFKAKIFREQTILKNGDINIDNFKALVCKDTLEFLQELGVQQLYKHLENQEYKDSNYTLVEFNISKLPVINRSCAVEQVSLDCILNLVYEQRLAECRQKVLKYYISKTPAGDLEHNKMYTKEQLDLLYTYGLAPNGVYCGVDNQLIDGSAKQYEYKSFQFTLKGFSRLPKLHQVIDKMKAGIIKSKGPEAIMAAYIKELAEKKLISNRAELVKLLEKEKTTIRKNTRQLAIIKLIQALTGGWWQGLQLDKNENYYYEGSRGTLVIKVVKKIANK